VKSNAPYQFGNLSDVFIARVCAARQKYTIGAA